MELLTEWFPGGKYIKLDTHFHTNFLCDKYLLSDTLPIKYLPEGTKILRYFISPGIK